MVLKNVSPGFLVEDVIVTAIVLLFFFFLFSGLLHRSLCLDRLLTSPSVARGDKGGANQDLVLAVCALSYSKSRGEVRSAG